MRDFIKGRILPFLAKRGFIVQEVMPKVEVLELIERLYPLQTQFDLIRLGPNKDGGYLVPDCLNDIEACFSPGVAKVSGFELDCLELGMKVFMADKSVEKPEWNIPKNQYDFKQKFIGCTDNEDFMTMDSWFQSTGLLSNAELLLQMDIEGGEYNAIINMSDALMSRFKIMVIEFHRLKHLWNKGFYEIAETVFKKILQTHICVHIHPNNFKSRKIAVLSQFGVEIPTVLEMSFIRKDIAEVKNYQTQFPHPLDFANTEKEHFPLPKSWYKTPVH